MTELLRSGTYTILNVRFRNLAVLRDANDLSEVVGSAQQDHAGEKVRTVARCN